MEIGPFVDDLPIVSLAILHSKLLNYHIIASQIATILY